MNVHRPFPLIHCQADSTGRLTAFRECSEYFSAAQYTTARSHARMPPFVERFGKSLYQVARYGLRRIVQGFISAVLIVQIPGSTTVLPSKRGRGKQIDSAKTRQSVTSARFVSTGRALLWQIGSEHSERFCTERRVDQRLHLCKRQAMEPLNHCIWQLTKTMFEQMQQ